MQRASRIGTAGWARRRDLGVGCGVEPMLYFLARHTARLYATDMYGWGWVSAQLDMLHHPEQLRALRVSRRSD